jgi:hypothetical protein
MLPLKAAFGTFTTLLKVLVICASLIVSIKGALIMSTAQSPSDEERKFKSKEFPDMPLRVRKVKNLQSETWPNDLKIEVENVSNKPIYFINAVLEFPDDPAPNGSSGIKFKFGNPENMDTARIAQPDDEHVDPGKTVVLTISEIYRKGLTVRQQKLPHNFKKLDFWFEIISFGDGTGYEGSQLLDSKKPVLIKGALMMSTAQSPSGQERKFKSKEFPDMPVRVRQVKNVQSENWPNELQIEIENVSTKPIYFINAVLSFPDDPAPNGISGILLQYGRLENLDIARVAANGDEHLGPGETTTLVISDTYKKGLVTKEKKAPQDFKKFEFWFDSISFGNGTGFQLDQFVDTKKLKNEN